MSTQIVRSVLDLICQYGPLSRQHIVRHTAFSTATVSKAVSQLLDQGIAVEIEPPGTGTSRIGRTAAYIALGSSVGAVIGIDFGRSHIRVALADLALNVRKVTGHRLSVANDGPKALGAAATMVRQLLHEANVSEQDVIGVGIALPGPLDRESGLASESVLPGWKGVQPKRALSERLGLPIVIDNDANVGALGELVFGAAQGYKHAIYILGTMGIGCGLIFDGKVYRGASGAAGELGHMVVESGGPVCDTCGNRGCVDTVLGGQAIVEMLRMSRSLPESLRPDQCLLWTIKSAKQGDLACQRAIHDVTRKLGMLLANLCDVVNPELIIVGGPLGGAGDIALQPIREAIKWRALPISARGVGVVRGKLKDRAEVLGALALVERGTDELVSARLHQLLAEHARVHAAGTYGAQSASDRGDGAVPNWKPSNQA